MFKLFSISKYPDKYIEASHFFFTKILSKSQHSEHQPSYHHPHHHRDSSSSTAPIILSAPTRANKNDGNNNNRNNGNGSNGGNGCNGDRAKGFAYGSRPSPSPPPPELPTKTPLPVIGGKEGKQLWVILLEHFNENIYIYIFLNNPIHSISQTMFELQIL